MSCEVSCECCIDRICRNISECQPNDTTDTGVILFVISILSFFSICLLTITCYHSCRNMKEANRRARRVRPQTNRTEAPRSNSQDQSQTVTFGNQRIGNLHELGDNNREMRSNEQQNPASSARKKKKKKKGLMKGTPEDNMPEMMEMMERPKELYKIGPREKVVKISLYQSAKYKDKIARLKKKAQKTRGKKEDEEDRNSPPQLSNLLINGDFKFKTSEEVITRPNQRTDFHSCSQPIGYDEGKQDISHISGLSDDRLISDKHQTEEEEDEINDQSVNDTIVIDKIQESEEDEKEKEVGETFEELI